MTRAVKWYMNDIIWDATPSPFKRMMQRSEIVLKSLSKHLHNWNKTNLNLYLTLKFGSCQTRWNFKYYLYNANVFGFQVSQLI